MEFDEWLGVAGAAGSPREYRAYLRASRWRQARPDAVKNANHSSTDPQLGESGVRGVRLFLVALIGVALALPAAAAAQTSGTNPLSQQPGSNPLNPGFPQPTVAVPTTTTAVPTIQTGTTAGSGSGFSGSSLFVITIGAIIVLGGISLYIWRDARRRAPTRTHAWAPGLEEGRRKGSKAPAKPRKLSPAERRRRKRGRAR